MGGGHGRSVVARLWPGMVGCQSVLSSLYPSLIYISSFAFSSTPYRIFLLLLPWLPCHFYPGVITTTTTWSVEFSSKMTEPGSSAPRPRMILDLIPLANWFSSITGSVSDSGSCVANQEFFLLKSGQIFRNDAHCSETDFLLHEFVLCNF